MFLEEHSLLVEELTFNYDAEDFSLYAGKFNPVVGFNYHRLPGIYGYQITESYRISERIGVGSALKYNADDYGKHQLDVSTFFADTTFLSDSILHDRGHTNKQDGGLANTEDFPSFAVSLGGSDFYSLNNNIVEGLNIALVMSNKQMALIVRKMKLGFQSPWYSQAITSDLGIEVLSEYLDISHLDGEENVVVLIPPALLGLIIKTGTWVALSLTLIIMLMKKMKIMMVRFFKHH